MKDKDLDNLFKNAFDDHEAPVPADMWQRVQPVEDKKRRVILWWKWYTAAAFLLVVGIATWWFAGNKPATQGNLDNITKQTAPRTIVTPQSPITAPKTPTATAQPGEAVAAAQPTIATAKPVGTGVSKIAITAQKVPMAGTQKTSFERTGKANDSKQPMPITSDGLNNEKAAASTPSEKKLGDFINNNTSAAPTAAAPGAIAKANDSLPVTAIITSGDTSVLSANAGKENTTPLQDAKQKNKRKPKLPWTVEILGAAALAHKQTYQVEKETPRGMAAPIPLEQPKPVMRSYNTGIRVGIPVSKSFTIKTGLQYARISQQATYQQQNVVDMMTVWGTNDTTFYRQLFYQSEHHRSTVNTVNVPVLVSYHTGTKTRFGATAGLVVNAHSWYTGKVPNATYSATQQAADVYRRRSGVAVFAGLNVARQAGNFQLFAEPYLQYSLSSITKPSVPFKQKINTYGVGIGVRMPLQ